MAIQERDRQEWAYSPVTQEFLRMLKDSRQTTMEAWAQQAFGTEKENAAALGGVHVLDQAIAVIEEFRNAVPTEGNA